MFAVFKIKKHIILQWEMIQKDREGKIVRRFDASNADIWYGNYLYFIIEYNYCDDFYILDEPIVSVYRDIAPGINNYNEVADITKEYFELASRFNIRMDKLKQVVNDNLYNIDNMLHLNVKDGEYARSIYNYIKKSIN